LVSPPLHLRTLEILSKQWGPPHDMLYIALAEEASCEFVTADRTLVNKLGGTFACVRWIGDL